MPCWRQSQLRSRATPTSARRAEMRTPSVASPATSANHGPIHGWVNDGGRRSARAEPAVMREASSGCTHALNRPGGRRSARESSQRARPRAAETAATIDHRNDRPQAPNGPEPSPNRAQGSIVAATSSPRAQPVNASTRDMRRRGGAGSRRGESGPSASARHSTPRTRPRTGVAQARQRGRPQPSQLATDGFAGCRSQRSALLVVRSSDGTDEAYPRSWPRRRLTPDPPSS
jgi:hypothetical protein